MFAKTRRLLLLISNNCCLRCANSMFSIYFYAFSLLTEILNFLFNEHKQHAIYITADYIRVTMLYGRKSDKIKNLQVLLPIYLIA